MRDMALVAVAGPLSNFLVAFLGLVALVLVARAVTAPFVAEPLVGMLRYIYGFNLGLAIFNLIPLPPLDGGHFLPYFFPRASWPLLARLEQYGPMILLLLVFSGATRYIIGPALRPACTALYLAASSRALHSCRSTAAAVPARPKRRRARIQWIRALGITPAATYSPAPLPAQYHRPRRA